MSDYYYFWNIISLTLEHIYNSGDYLHVPYVLEITEKKKKKKKKNDWFDKLKFCKWIWKKNPQKEALPKSPLTNICHTWKSPFSHKVCVHCGHTFFIFSSFFFSFFSFPFNFLKVTQWRGTNELHWCYHDWKYLFVCGNLRHTCLPFFCVGGTLNFDQLFSTMRSSFAIRTHRTFSFQFDCWWHCTPEYLRLIEQNFDGQHLILPKLKLMRKKAHTMRNHVGVRTHLKF